MYPHVKLEHHDNILTHRYYSILKQTFATGNKLTITI